MPIKKGFAPKAEHTGRIRERPAGGPPGARASRSDGSFPAAIQWRAPGSAGVPPAQHRQSLAHLLDPDRPAKTPGLCLGRAHAVPACRVNGCAIAGKPSGNPRERMRAGRPRSGGILRCTGVPDGSIRYWAGGVAAEGPAGEVCARLNRLIMSEVMSTELSLNRTWLFWLDEFRIR